MLRGLFFCLPKNAPFRDHENSFTGHVPPMCYEKHRNLRNLTDIALVRQDAKKGPRSTMALDRRCFFFKSHQSFEGCHLTIHPEFEYADCAFLFYSTPLYFRFFFWHFGRMPLSLFAKLVAGLATKCPVKEHFWVTKRWVHLDKKRWRHTSLREVCTER